MMQPGLIVTATVLLIGLSLPQRGFAESAPAGRFAGYEEVVAETHRASLEARERVLRDVVAADGYWIEGNWGETLWCLASLYLNEKPDL